MQISSAKMTPWQAMQAAMLYHYASTESLRQLHALVTQLIEGVVDPILELAKRQGRDTIMTDPRWGQRNTSENWAGGAWPFLKDLQAGLAKDIAMRSFEQYRQTPTDECLRGAEQFSMQWATEAEEQRYQDAVRLINELAGPIDNTLENYGPGRWSDYGFMSRYPAFAKQNLMIPSFRIRSDIVCESGKPAPRTGVYISANDPLASLQFAWAGPHPCVLRNAATFNEIGRAALAHVGRANLWIDFPAMFDFVTRGPFSRLLAPSLTIYGTTYPTFAPSIVAKSAFEHVPSTWYFVEVAEEMAVSSALSWEPSSLSVPPARMRAGDVCEVGGFYFTPAAQNSRRFVAAGERFPTISSDYGEAFWQWDPQQ